MIPEFVMYPLYLLGGIGAIVMLLIAYWIAKGLYIGARYGEAGAWLVRIKGENRTLYRSYKLLLSEQQRVEIRHMADSKEELKELIMEKTRERLGPEYSDLTMEELEAMT